MKNRIIIAAAFTACLALCAAVCAFKGWGGVCTRQSPLKRVLRRLWAMCEKNVWIRLRRWRNEPLGRVLFPPDHALFQRLSPLIYPFD